MKVFDGVRQNVDNRNVRTNLFANFKVGSEFCPRNFYYDFFRIYL